MHVFSPSLWKPNEGLRGNLSLTPGMQGMQKILPIKSSSGNLTGEIFITAKFRAPSNLVMMYCMYCHLCIAELD